MSERLSRFLAVQGATGAFGRIVVLRVNSLLNFGRRILAGIASPLAEHNVGLGRPRLVQDEHQGLRYTQGVIDAVI